MVMEERDKQNIGTFLYTKHTVGKWKVRQFRDNVYAYAVNSINNTCSIEENKTAKKDNRGHIN